MAEQDNMRTQTAGQEEQEPLQTPEAREPAVQEDGERQSYEVQGPQPLETQPPAWQIAAAQEPDKQKERDYAAEFLADAARRARDQELEALASLALIRSDMAHRNSLRPEDAPSPQDLDERLRQIFRD